MKIPYKNCLNCNSSIPKRRLYKWIELRAHLTVYPFEMFTPLTTIYHFEKQTFPDQSEDYDDDSEKTDVTENEVEGSTDDKQNKDEL